MESCAKEVVELNSDERNLNGIWNEIFIQGNYFPPQTVAGAY